MAKKPAKLQEKAELMDFLDFIDNEDNYDDGYEGTALIEIMSNVVEISNCQMAMSLELTKLIVGNDNSPKKDDHVLAAFKKATQAVSDNFNLQNLIKQLQI